MEIRGEVKGSEDLMIDGHVEGTITLTDSRLTVGPTARVDADVSARDVVILGVLNGNVTASMRVDLRKGANLTGDIRAARLSIEEGSIFSGKVDLTPPGAVPAKSVPAVLRQRAQGRRLRRGCFPRNPAIDGPLSHWWKRREIQKWPSTHCAASLGRHRRTAGRPAGGSRGAADSAPLHRLGSLAQAPARGRGLTCAGHRPDVAVEHQLLNRTWP